MPLSLRLTLSSLSLGQRNSKIIDGATAPSFFRRKPLNIVLNPPPAPAAIVITHNTGGLVDDYFAAARRFTITGQRIEVSGECRSACTILLEVPTICVRPGAVFRWHHAYEQRSGVVRSDITDLMLSHLPSRISARLQGRISVNYTAQASLGYSELLTLGVPACTSKK
jgi:hypothetical protein